MTLSETPAGLTLADFLFSRLSPRSKQKVESDYYSRNPQQHQHSSQNSVTHTLRDPRLIRTVGGNTKVKQLNLAVSSFRQALNNIVNIKESLFQNIFPGGEIPYQDAGTFPGPGSVTKEVPGPYNSPGFRPSLSDPLRPAVKELSSLPSQSNQEFSAPRERTPINMAIIGQKVSARKPGNVEIKTQSYSREIPEKIKGKLRVPEERTHIDTPVFADDIFKNKHLVIKTFDPVGNSEENVQYESFQDGEAAIKEFVKVI